MAPSVSRRGARNAIALLLLASASRAATFTVDAGWDDLDAVPGDGICATSMRRCTLRAAVQESNALPGADVIRVPAGTYALGIPGGDEDLSATGDLDVRDAVTILGAGAGATVIDARGIDRCLHVMSGPTEVAGLGLRGGGGPFDGSAWSGAGLAVDGRASVMVRECQVTDNQACLGGGMFVGSGCSLTVDRTTVMDNTAAYDVDSGEGGGLYADAGAVLVLLDSTVSWNLAPCGGGIKALTSSVTLRGCTVTRNQGGLNCDASGMSGQRFELANTILADNSGAPDCSGTIVSLGYNLLGAPARFGCIVGGDLTGNIVGVPLLLGPLADNGGPAPTHSLLAGSPAIDAGNPLPPGGGGVACGGQDERGRLRPRDGDLDGVSMCDIGAFELGVETGSCTDGTDDDGDTLVDCADPDCCADVACAFMPETECCDAIDNDCDGDVDLADSNCSSAPDCVELDCANLLDDDGDRLVDCFDEDCCGDAACALPEAQCCDRLDNDCDGLTDLADPDCAVAPPCVESDCANGVDDDVDGRRDCADADCSGAPACIESECTNGVDDDGDARVDCADPDCRGTPTCDDDGDGAPNGSDCAPRDPGAFRLPTEVPRLDVGRRVELGTDVVALSWTDLSGPAGPGLVTDVFVGGIARMWADRSLVGASCLAGNVRVLQALDFRALPAPGDGFWYLVRAENACGTGPLGNDSLGVPRDLAGVSCP